MNYKIGGIPISDLGARPGKLNHLAVGGIFNLPKRVGKTEHDWGNSIEPFVQAEDIELDGREITFLAIVKDGYLDLFKDACIEAKTFSCTLDSYNVVCRSAIDVESVGPFHVVEVKFYQPNVMLEPLAFVPSGHNAISINGYDLHGFGIILARGIGMDDVAKRIEVNTTEFYDKAYFRGLRGVSLKFAMVGGSVSGLYGMMKQFHSLIASPGMKQLRIGNRTFDVYFKSGLTAELVNDRILKFELIATVND